MPILQYSTVAVWACWLFMMEKYSAEKDEDKMKTHRTHERVYASFGFLTSLSPMTSHFMPSSSSNSTAKLASLARVLALNVARVSFQWRPVQRSQAFLAPLAASQVCRRRGQLFRSRW
uniref:Putative secreted protein n=1 Tax=Amblyomma triste TaxID=251400 RepID=A0A023G4C9_AMBTT